MDSKDKFDLDPSLSNEWNESLEELLKSYGPERTRDFLRNFFGYADSLGLTDNSNILTTRYRNTIPAADEPSYPGSLEIEKKIRALLRWNAVAMVIRGNKRVDGLGGHLATYASAATLMEVGFNHFFKGSENGQSGDQVFFQGHASPGIYARAYLEGRLTEGDLDCFRRETGSALGGDRGVNNISSDMSQGLSSYPHPRLMPEFWQFPTVSMGLGPLMAIHQAHINRYVSQRGIKDLSDSRVWAFVGDGEMDEPESSAALGLAAREGLDNLIFVVNCNLQRLDGPVRGNGKVIQDFEQLFKGSGWNVIKVIWGGSWDQLLEADQNGLLQVKMDQTLDGQYQFYATSSGDVIRSEFFGSELSHLVSHLSDPQLARLERGGHDVNKIYAAFKKAVETSGKPTAILAKTVKGWDLGQGIEARNAAHAVKQMKAKDLIELRDRLGLQQYVSNEELEGDLPPYIRPDPNSPEISYLLKHRHDLNGFIPRRNVLKPKPELSSPSLLPDFVEGSKSQLVSTTGVMARIIRNLARDQKIGKRIVPIVPDEGRSFGLESLFSEIGIYAPFGQHYIPVDADLILKYRESSTGQILEEGITEAGAMASFIAASTACATFGEPIIPFFMFYSMFGFQRIGDLIWALGDIRGKGFLVGTTAGRTTYSGEGLQHEDGHSHLTALSYPAIVSYDPSFAYELAIIVEHGIKDMYGPNQRDVSYYITTYNEAYPMPKIPEHLQIDELKRDVISGIYKYSENKNEEQDQISGKIAIWFSGPLGPVAIRAGEILLNNYGIESEMWSLTSVNQLRQNALEADLANCTNSGRPQKISRIEEVCEIIKSPILAVTDYVRALPDLLTPWINYPYITLGTDGFGLSDSRPDLRAYFHIDEISIVIAALRLLKRDEEAESLFQSRSDELQQIGTELI